jgi:acetylornithine/N-succinyldiaminopimelate aminotransferase
MLAGPRVAAVLQYGAHGSTFGGNPLAAAVAKVALRRLSDPTLLAQVQRRGEALRASLQALAVETGVIASVRGRGLMLGAVLAEAHRGQAGAILDHAHRAGLLLLQAGADVLRIVPPLVLDDDDVSQGLARLRAALHHYLDARQD